MRNTETITDMRFKPSPNDYNHLLSEWSCLPYKPIISIDLNPTQEDRSDVTSLLQAYNYGSKFHTWILEKLKKTIHRAIYELTKILKIKFIFESTKDYKNGSVRL